MAAAGVAQHTLQELKLSPTAEEHVLRPNHQFSPCARDIGTTGDLGTLSRCRTSSRSPHRAARRVAKPPHLGPFRAAAIDAVAERPHRLSVRATLPQLQNRLL